ncbi:MAG TPA: hypothetical protein VF266_19955, partial [Thermoanaerobaculia bacterium]
MLTAAALSHYTGPELLRALGYPVSPIDVDAEEWRRGGVELPWNGNGKLQLVSRLPRFDFFVLSGNVSEEAIAQFMRSYREYNRLTKSALFYENAIYDLSPERALRRLDVDPRNIDRINLLARGDDESLPRIFDRALDREQVTREFFLRFRAAVRDVAKALPGGGQAILPVHTPRPAGQTGQAG